MRLTTKQAAKGKWDGILVTLIGEEAVTRKHGPCPMCGGTDRYRYDNNRNDGDWYCNNCGTGDGFKLLMDALGIDFSEAAKRVDRVVNNIEEKPFKPEVDTEKRRKELNSVWATGKQPEVAVNYLTSRGIPTELIEDLRDIRGAARLRMYEDNEYVGMIPAMLALIRSPKGEPVSIHRTYITSDGKQKKIMPPLQNITGCCVRLGEPNDTLVLAEGIETALAASCLTGHAAWATISAHGLAEMKSIPGHVKRVIIAADNDESFTGQAAAFTCAKYMSQRLHVETEVTMPETIGFDMLDVLSELLENGLLLKGGHNSIGLHRWTS